MAIYNLKNEYEAQNFLEHARQLVLEAGKKDFCMVELKKKHPQRTLQQNKYLYVLLGYYAQEFGYSIDEVKQDIFKRQCNKDLFERSRVNKRGNEVVYLRSSAELSTSEMTLAIERFRNYSSAVAGLYLPSPNESNFIAYCEQQIERYKEYM